MRQSFLETVSLKGRTALVTGAAGHIGLEICYSLAEFGADLILVDRDEAKMTQQAKALEKKFGIAVACFRTDLELEADRRQMIEKVKESLSPKKPLNILVNNAAFVGDSELQGWTVPFESQTLDTWRRALEVNLNACFHLCQGFASDLKAAPAMTHGARSSIINIGSIYGHQPPNWSIYEGTNMGNPAAYAVSKAGLHGLTTWLSTTLAPDVRVNTISPGGVYRGQPTSFVEKYIKTRRLPEMLTEQDVANAVAVFACDLTRACTGENLVLG